MQPVSGLVFVYFPGVPQPLDASIFQAPGPINSGIWDCICTQASATPLIQQVASFKEGSAPRTNPLNGSPVTISNVKLVANDASIPWRFVALDPTIHVWNITCDIEYNNVAYTGRAFAVADVLNRAQYPNPFTDYNPDSSLGGPNLYLSIIDNTATGGEVGFDLRWGK